MHDCAGWLRRILFLTIAGIALAGSGCLAVAAGAAVATGGVATYAYLNGGVPGDVNADVPNTANAAQFALKDLNLPMLGVKQDADGALVTSRTADGTAIDIALEKLPVKTDADGAKTRVLVRVGYLGDKELSERLLVSLGKHLEPGQGKSTAAPPLAAVNQTGPPPLAAAPSTGVPPLAAAPQAGPPPLAAPASQWQRTPAGN